jgi:methyl acetate hydrolase
MGSLSKAASEEAIKLLNDATANPSHDVPGAVFIVINRNGKSIFSHASGPRSLADTNVPMAIDSTFWLASFTKTITGIAAMQLYEQGKLDLDSTSQLEQIFPEGAKAKLITGNAEDGKPIFEEKNNKMTARMLLTHTSRLVTLNRRECADRRRWVQL